MIYAATEDNYTLIVQPDDEPVNPREDCNPFGRMVCWHRRYRLGDQHDYDAPEDFLRSLRAEPGNPVILPLYLYDHSGLSISTGSFVGRAVHAEWDSGQVGYIYATREDIVNNYGDASLESVEKAKALLEAEVQSYDWYLQGECLWLSSVSKRSGIGCLLGLPGRLRRREGRYRLISSRRL